MSFRAVLLGLLAAAMIAGLGYINDNVLRLTFLVGNHFPISVFGLLILLAILVNPAMFGIRGGSRLRSTEMAVIIAFMLSACSIPGSGLMRTFLPTLALPMRYNHNLVGWRNHHVLDLVPSRMLPGGPGEPDPQTGQYDHYDKALMDEFFKPGQTGEVFVPARVPWSKWGGALATWIPIISLISLATICMGMVVHSQWARRERLRYPIARFASALIEQDPQRGAGPLLRNKLFWLGLIAVLGIHLVNGIQVWCSPDNSLSPANYLIPLRFQFPAIAQKWPALASAGGEAGGNFLLNFTLYPTAVAFAFFLASDVALSLGLSQVFYVILSMFLVAAGVQLGGGDLTGGPINWQLFGSYLGFALLIGYTGRRYYRQLLKQALTFLPNKEIDGSTAWACRILLLSAAGLVVYLSVPGFGIGLDWPFSVLLVFLVLLMFLVVARINAEAGMFFIQPSWAPFGVIMAIFGAKAMGPSAIVVVGLLCAVLTVDPRECLLPFIVNGLKIADDAGARPSRVGWGAAGVFAVALAVAVPVTLIASYNSSVPSLDKWANRDVPTMTFKTAITEMDQLSNAGQLEKSASYTTAQRLKNVSANPKFLWAAGIGVALALGFSAMRLRFTWWPLHPVMFLVWGTWAMAQVSHSFMLGWLLKVLVTKFGGGQKHRQVMALMIGVIAGDLLGGLAFMVFGGVYFGITHLTPRTYWIFPG